MGRKNASELGQRRPATRRPGVEGFPGWGGMVLKGDPGSIPVNRFRYAQNVRFGAGGGIGGGTCIGSRGGLRQINGSPLHGTTIGLYDFQSARPYGLWFASDGCPGISSSAGFSLNNFDHETENKVNRGTYYDTATSMSFASFAGNLYIAVDNVIKILALIRPAYGKEALEVAGYEQAESIATFSGSTITCMQEFDGRLYVGLDDGAGSGRILTWDGLSFVLDLTLAATYVPRAMSVWRDKLIVGFDAAPGGIRIRNVGTPPGTWSGVVAGLLRPYQMVSYRDVLYMSDGATKIWKYDGSTLAAARTIAGAQIHGLAPFNSLLYYGYRASNGHAMIGKFDGATSTWTDAEKDLFAQFAATSMPETPRVMARYRGALVVGCITPTGGMLYLSPTTATGGTYTSHVIAALNNGDIVQMGKY